LLEAVRQLEKDGLCFRKHSEWLQEGMCFRKHSECFSALGSTVSGCKRGCAGESCEDAQVGELVVRTHKGRISCEDAQRGDLVMRTRKEWLSGGAGIELL